jgi:hypothetical protein
MRRHLKATIVLAGALALGAGSAPSGTSGASPGSPPAGPSGADATEQAKGALREMATRLGTAKTLAFSVHSLLPIQGHGGGWVTLNGEGRAMRQGNDRLFIETGGDLQEFKLYFDGKTVTVFAPREKKWAQKDAPATIDAMLDREAKSGEIAYVFGDLLSADPYAAMTNGLLSAYVVGTSTVDDVETRHLAVHGKKLDWEIWIGTSDRLPRLVTLTDTSDPRKPTQTVRLSEWSVDQPLPPDTFALQLPADAKKIPFKPPEEAKAGAAARRGPAAGRP